MFRVYMISMVYEYSIVLLTESGESLFFETVIGTNSFDSGRKMASKNSQSEIVLHS